jgi:hypothetical protein
MNERSSSTPEDSDSFEALDAWAEVEANFESVSRQVARGVMCDGVRGVMCDGVWSVMGCGTSGVVVWDGVWRGMWAVLVAAAGSERGRWNGRRAVLAVAVPCPPPAAGVEHHGAAAVQGVRARPRDAQVASQPPG